MSVRVDHNYPHPGDLRVVDPSGIPLENVEIRIYTHASFYDGSLIVQSRTLTDINGEWVDPIYLPEGETWVVHFQRLTVVGADHVEITT